MMNNCGALAILSPESLGKFAPDTAQSLIGLSVNDPRVPTPSFLIEDEKLEKNLERARTRARELGVAFRPHLKTVPPPFQRCRRQDTLRRTASRT